MSSGDDGDDGDDDGDDDDDDGDDDGDDDNQPPYPLVSPPPMILGPDILLILLTTFHDPTPILR